MRFGLIGMATLAACATGGSTSARRVTQFSPSSPLKVLFLDFKVKGMAEGDIERLGDLFVGALMDARQAEIVNARDLPEVRDEASKAAFEGKRDPPTLAKRASSLGADYAIAGSILRTARGWAFEVGAVDTQGEVVDGAGGKVNGDLSALELAVRKSGGDMLRPMPKGEGPPTTSDAARILSARQGLFDRCYGLGLMRLPNLVGRGVIMVTLGDSPVPSDVKIALSSFNDGMFEDCVTYAVRGLRFPVLVGETTLKFPIAYAE